MADIPELEIIEVRDANSADNGKYVVLNLFVRNGAQNQEIVLTVPVDQAMPLISTINAGVEMAEKAQGKPPEGK